MNLVGGVGSIDYKKFMGTLGMPEVILIAIVLVLLAIVVGVVIALVLFLSAKKK